MAAEATQGQAEGAGQTTERCGAGGLPSQAPVAYVIS